MTASPYPGTVFGLLLLGSYACHHNHGEFLCTTAQAGLRTAVLLWPSIVPGWCMLSRSLLRPLNLGRKSCDTDVPLRTEHSCTSCSVNGDHCGFLC